MSSPAAVEGMASVGGQMLLEALRQGDEKMWVDWLAGYAAHRAERPVVKGAVANRWGNTFRQLFIYGARSGDLALYDRLFHLNPSEGLLEKALFTAASNGQTEWVRRLLLHVPPSPDDATPLCFAILGGHVDTVKVLMGWADLSADHFNAFRVAVKNERAEMVSLLLPHLLSRPSYVKKAAERALALGEYDVCEYLSALVSEPLLERMHEQLACMTDRPLPLIASRMASVKQARDLAASLPAGGKEGQVAMKSRKRM